MAVLILKDHIWDRGGLDLSFDPLAHHDVFHHYYFKGSHIGFCKLDFLNREIESFVFMIERNCLENYLCFVRRAAA